MADDDDDDEDLWTDFDNDDDEVQVMLSANLCTVAGVEEHTVHEGDVDEGKVMWEAPSFAGLSNSQAVDSGVHWYAPGDSGAASDTQTGGGIFQAAAPLNFSSFATEGGGIDWNALSSFGS